MIIRREESGPRTTELIVGCVIVLSVLCASIILYLVLRHLRARHPEPRFIPTKYLKDRWRKWTPSSHYNQLSAGPTATTEQTGLSAMDTAYPGSGGTAAEASQVAIDRNTSIRSVMTLPAYSPNPKPSEQVIGREGERAGMDVVVEFPETVDEEESRRDNEMESLYQIRLARRREIAEREERRQRRREARERGDWVLLEQIRAERRGQDGSQGTLTGNDGEAVSASSLLAEHRARGRDRRVSSVSYADVGHVRHDGSRVRASSQGSDSRPLLDTAASMAQDGSRRPSVHHRSLSGTSLMTQSTTSELEQHPIPDDELGASITQEPPPYEQLDLGEAPPYPESSADSFQSAQPSPMSIVPSIAVENATPPPSTPGTPVSPTGRNVSLPTSSPLSGRT